MNTSPPAEPPIPPDLPEDPSATYDPGTSSTHASGSVRNHFLETVVLGTDLLPDAAKGDAASTSGEQGARRNPRIKTPGVRPAAGGPPPRSSAETPRFLLNRKIAEGGFGEVWEAHQTSLSRPIAVKRLKHNSSTVDTGVFTGDIRAAEVRFRQEALTAAHLEHPNIVPVHDLGTDADGRPLLAMKLVDGHDWRTVLAEDFQNLPSDEYLTKHLQILISLAQAVAFAHSRGIIHRDLKPAQVMLGSFGEVLLMDWGLAMAWPLRPEGTEEAPKPRKRGRNPVPSVPGVSPLHFPINPAGTAAYMAPEQTDPTPKRLGPWTDVWLLGAILYEILTGTAPHFAKTSAVAFRLAKEGNIIPLEERAPYRDIPRSLESLVLQAMAKEPADRIPSAQAFLAELQSWLTGADKRRESRELTERVADILQVAADDYGRLSDALNLVDRALILWPRNTAAADLRQRALVQYARSALMQNDLRLARVQAERLDRGPARDMLLEEVAVLQEVRRIEKGRYSDALRQAKADRERAEGLVRFLLDDLHSALKSIGRLDIIRTVTQHVHGYFDSLTDAEVTDQTLHNRSIAYMNIGDLLSAEGKKPEAQEVYFKARELALQLISRDPESVDYQLNLADAYERCGRIHYFQGRAEESLKDHGTAFQIRESLASRFPLPDPSEEANGTSEGGHGHGESPPSPQVLRLHAALASSRHDLGIVAWRHQQLDRALELQTGALEDFRRLQKLAAASPHPQPMRPTATVPDADHAIAWIYSTLGNVYRDLGQLDRAIEVTREGLAMRTRLSDEQPANSSRLEDQMWTRSNLALLLLLRGDLEESLALFSDDIEQRRQLSERDPENVVRIGALVFPLAAIGEIRFILGQVQEAETAVRECLDVSRSLLARDPTSAWAMGGYAIQASQLSEILLTRGRWDEAAPLIRLALARARQVTSLAPKNATYLLALARSLALQGRLLLHEAPEDKTERARQQAVTLWQEALATLQGIEAVGEQLSILDLKAQLAYLLGPDEETPRLLQRLRERRWISPYLAQIIGETA